MTARGNPVLDWLAPAAAATAAAPFSCSPGARGGRRDAGKTRNRPRARKRLADRIAREVVHELRMPEAHLDFRRVNVHVHFLGGQIEKQQHRRKNRGRQHVAVGLVNRVEDQAVAHQALVYENVNSVAIAALHFGPRSESAHDKFRGALFAREFRFGDRRAHGRANRQKFKQIVERLPTEKLVDALGHRLDGRRVNDFLRRRLQHELFVGMRERVMRDERSDVPEFRRLRLQEIAPRRHAVKKIGHADRRPRRQPLRVHADKFSARKFDARSLFFLGRARLQQQARDRGDRRQRLAAKPERRDREQIVGRAQLRRRVPLKRQQRVVVNHPGPVVDHANHPLAARFHFHANRPRPRVQRVFEQFFHNGRGSLDHFARGDLVRDVLRKYAYSCHGSFRRAGLQPGRNCSLDVLGFSP